MLKRNESNEAESFALSGRFVQYNCSVLDGGWVARASLEVVYKAFQIFVGAHRWDADQNNALIGRSSRFLAWLFREVFAGIMTLIGFRSRWQTGVRRCRHRRRVFVVVGLIRLRRAWESHNLFIRGCILLLAVIVAIVLPPIFTTLRQSSSITVMLALAVVRSSSMTSTPASLFDGQ